MSDSTLYRIQIAVAVALVTLVWQLLPNIPGSSFGYLPKDGVGIPQKPRGLQANAFDYSSVNSVTEKKQLFFDILRPLVQEENRKLAELRRRLLALSVNGRRQDWVLDVAERYKVEVPLTGENWTELMRRIDTIPLEMALAQAAVESGWGESRFAQLGNNLFGQWCFTEGCGIVPNQRAEGASHEVRRFDSVNDAMVSYMHNLNMGHAYDDFRQMRASLRQLKLEPDAATLAGGLSRYSEKGGAYVEEIRQVMRVNRKLILGSQP